MPHEENTGTKGRMEAFSTRPDGFTAIMDKGRGPQKEKDDAAVADAHSGSSSSNDVSPSEEESEDQRSHGPNDLLDELYRNKPRDGTSINQPDDAAKS